MPEAVKVNLEGGVATVTIANPPVNSLTDPVLDELAAAAATVAASEARAAVLTGGGERTFVAGADLNQFAAALGDREAMRTHVSFSRRAFEAWDGLDLPVLAAVGGHAVGGGLELALLCDLIVADPRARFGLPEVTLGLIPGAGGTQRLARRVGPGTAARLLLTGELIKAEPAAAAGLVDLLAAEGEALPEATQLAARLAAQPGRATAAAKRALRAARQLPLDQGLELERELFLEVAGSADAREGVGAFLEKRQPEFRHC